MTASVPSRDLGPYRLEELLGRGGMGEVYRAVDQRLGRQVAIKHLPPSAAGGDETRRRRFRLEAATLARLSHPAIVQIFDLYEADDGDWIVMELVQGPTLAELLERGPLPLGMTIDFGRQIAEGLAEAHGQGLLHRDLKAENVMLKRPATGSQSSGSNQPSGSNQHSLTASRTSGGRSVFGQVKILDFGLAKDLQEEDRLSVSGQILGTLRCMSPEQVRGLPLDPRSDLFSLGLLLYELTTGVPAFRGSSDFDTLQRITLHPHRPASELRPEMPPRLATLIDRLLEKSPGDRPASADEVADELAQIAAQAPAQTASWPRVSHHDELTREDLPTLDAWPADQNLPGPQDLEGSSLGSPPPQSGYFERYRLRPFVLLLGAVALLAAVGWWLAGSAEKPAAGPVEGLAAEPDAFALFQEGMAWLERPDKKGHLDKAITAFEAALARDENSAAAHAGLALAYRRQYFESRDPAHLAQARTVAERAVRLDEHLALARVALGSISAWAGDDAAALRELEIALQLDPRSVEAYRGLGEAHRRKDRFADAIAAYQKAVQLAPRDHSLHDQLGILYYRTARYDEAAAEFRQSLELVPDRAEAYRDLGAVYYMQGRLAEAAEAFQKALAIRPDHSLYSNLGTILFAQGLYPPAAAAFEKALEHGGANFYLYWANFADAERQLADRQESARASYAQAISLLHQELEKNPESLFLRSRLALYRAKRGDCGAAAKDLEEMARQGDHQAEGHYRSAVAWEVCGKRAAALASLGAALEAGYPPAQVAADPELFGLRADPAYRRLVGGGGR